MMPRAWWGGAVLALALLAAHIVFDGWLSPLRGKSFDIYQTLAPAPAIRSPVVLVAIDEESLARFGRWPWNRGTVARLLTAIADNGARAIGLDILFPEPDLGEGGPAGDRRLVAALGSTPSVLPASIGDIPSTFGSGPKAGWSLVGDVPTNLPSIPGIVASQSAFNEAASGLGIIRSTPDGDGTLRQLPLVWLQSTSGDPRLWPSFALELVRVFLGEESFAARMSEGGFDALKIGEHIVPLSAAGTILLRERRGSLPVVSALALMNGDKQPWLDGAIAIVAVNAVGLDQYHLTPARVPRLGPDIHGMLIEQILTDDFPSQPEHAKNVERVWFGIGTLLILALGSLVVGRPTLAVFAMVVVVISPFVAALSAFVLRDVFYEGMQPAAGLLLVAVTSGYANFHYAEQKRRALQRQFSQFLSPEIVSQLARSDAEALIAVEKREVTVLMMDIRGFTTMTRTLRASQIVEIVNHFLGIATDEILKRNGTIDKFMGDAVLAIWNAPIETPDHAERAIDAAESIIDRVASQNSELTARNLPPLRIGAGLETGICSVGNYGSSRRIDYTAIGDPVNLAARLESATKAAGIPLLGGPGFKAAFSRPMQPVGGITAHGFDEKVEAFTLPRFAKNAATI